MVVSLGRITHFVGLLVTMFPPFSVIINNPGMPVDFKS